jgi:hypothetical protein
VLIAHLNQTKTPHTTTRLVVQYEFHVPATNPLLAAEKVVAAAEEADIHLRNAAKCASDYACSWQQMDKYLCLCY